MQNLPTGTLASRLTSAATSLRLLTAYLLTAYLFTSAKTRFQALAVRSRFFCLSPLTA